MKALSQLQKNNLSAAITDLYEQEIECISGAILKHPSDKLLRRKVVMYFPAISDDELYLLLKFCGVNETIVYDDNYYYDKVNVFSTDTKFIADESPLVDFAKPAKG